MNKVIATIFAYMLSVSSAFASPLMDAESLLAKYIANENKVTPRQINIQIIEGKQALATSNANSVTLAALKVNEKTQKFYSLVTLDSGENIEVNGKYSKLAGMPVLARSVGKGEVITEADITTAMVSEKVLNRGYVNDISTLLGKAAKRAIHAGRPVMLSQLMAPTVVSKDSNVTMRLASAIIKLEDAGIAMENGGIGEYIRVKNANSNKIVKAKVVSANIVEVAPLGQVYANN